LVLVGEKDAQFAAQYPDSGPYVFFVIPKAQVPFIVTSGAAIGGNVQINTDPAAVRSPASKAFEGFLVSQAKVELLLGCGHTT
jgi:hypothetical protein